MQIMIARIRVKRKRDRSLNFRQRVFVQSVRVFVMNLESLFGREPSLAFADLAFKWFHPRMREHVDLQI